MRWDETALFEGLMFGAWHATLTAPGELQNFMSWKDTAIVALASEPCRTLLRWVGTVPGGREILERISYPRIAFENFEEAWAAARRSGRAGHDRPEYIRFHLEISKGLRASDYPVLYWLQSLSKGNLRVFDFGGHVGNLFYPYSDYLAGTTHVREWIVFDLPKTLEAGRQIAAERGAPLLHFTDSCEDFTQDHVLLVSGAFHYWEKSVEAFVTQFPHEPQHIIVNRTPVTKRGPSFFTVQSSEAYVVPCIVRTETELLSDFAKMGYTLADHWPVDELSLRMPLFPDRAVSQYSGFYFRRDAA